MTERGEDRRDWSAQSAAADRFAQEHPRPSATVADVVEHVEHVREVAGIDHVGLGGDYDGTTTLPEGLEDVTGYPRLLAALVDKGWSDDDLAKLTSGNILRVMRDAEAGARALQEERGPSLSTIAELDGIPPSHDRGA
jgi:membrane dipeptidase